MLNRWGKNDPMMRRSSALGWWIQPRFPQEKAMGMHIHSAHSAWGALYGYIITPTNFVPGLCGGKIGGKTSGRYSLDSLSSFGTVCLLHSQGREVETKHIRNMVKSLWEVMGGAKGFISKKRGKVSV